MASGETDIPIKRTTKSVRSVPSRYKQAALKVSKPSSRGNTPSHIDKQSDKTARLGIDINCSDFDITPLVWNRNEAKNSKPGKFTSTPSSDGVKVPVPVCDASVINADQSSFMPHLKEQLVKKSTRLKPNRCLSKALENPIRLPVIVIPQDQQKRKEAKVNVGEEFSESDLDLLYNQYVQAVFLESRAKKSLEMRSNDALENLHKLWRVNQWLMEEDKSLNKELDVVSYMQQLLEHFNKLEKVIKPVLQILPALMGQYAEISEAVDSIRHKLPVSGISFSSNFEDELVMLLEKCDSLLQSLLKSLSPEQAKLTVVADLLSKVQNLVDETTTAVDRCHHLLAAADTMVLRESSLKIAEIQTHQRKNS